MTPWRRGSPSRPESVRMLGIPLGWLIGACLLSGAMWLVLILLVAKLLSSLP